MQTLVYAVKPKEDNEELRYSLRSVAKYVHKPNVILVGFKPSWVRNVNFIPTRQKLGKYQNACLNWRTALASSTVPNEFVRMNDDFFFLQPTSEIKRYHRGDARTILARRQQGSTALSRYTRGMRQTIKILSELGIDSPKCYELHIPSLIDKNKRAEIVKIARVFQDAGQVVHTSTLYGNLLALGGQQTNDVKIYDQTRTFGKDWQFVSTDDNSFMFGRVGKDIRNLFPNRCEFEEYQ